MHLDFTRRMRWLTVLAVVLVAWVAPAHAQQPQPLLDANGEVREEAYDYLSRPLGAEDRKYESIRGVRLKELMKEVVAFSRLSRDAGDRQWGRMAGGPYEAMTADWSQAIFEELGMENIRRQYFDLPPQWTPVDWEFTATGGDRQLTFGSLLPASGSSPIPEGTQLEAVWVGSGSEADFLNRDVRGRAVVLQTILAPGQMSHSANWEGATVRAEGERRRHDHRHLGLRREHGGLAGPGRHPDDAHQRGRHDDHNPYAGRGARLLHGLGRRQAAA